jgi:hypothetical protein
MPELPREVLVTEVGTRDGFQSLETFVPTATKIELLNAFVRAGLRRIEATSFVSPRAVPQLADAAEVIAGIDRSTGVRVAALVPNEKGAERAAAAGLRARSALVGGRHLPGLVPGSIGRARLISADHERGQLSDLVPSETINIAERVRDRWAVLLLLHEHVPTRDDEITFGDGLVKGQLRRLRIHRSHPFTDVILASHCRLADHRPREVIRAERQDFLQVALGKCIVDALNDFLSIGSHEYPPLCVQGSIAFRCKATAKCRVTSALDGASTSVAES